VAVPTSPASAARAQNRGRVTLNFMDDEPFSLPRRSAKREGEYGTVSKGRFYYVRKRGVKDGLRFQF